MHFVGYQVDLIGITFESLFFPVVFSIFGVGESRDTSCWYISRCNLRDKLLSIASLAYQYISSEMIVYQTCFIIVC